MRFYFQYCQRLANAPAESFEALRSFPSADVLVKEAGAWIPQDNSRPFFLWLHFMDPHSPYYPKPEALDWMGDAGLDAIEGEISELVLEPWRSHDESP